MSGVGDGDTLRSACVALMKRPQVVEDPVHRTADFYCVCLDDRPRSNIPFGHYRLYRRLLEEIAQRG
jgi:hypothetical protein